MHFKCYICLSDCPLTELRILTCGHAFCATTLKGVIDAATRAAAPRCPFCKVTIDAKLRASVGVRLYNFELAPGGGGPEADVRRVADGISRTPGDAAASTVERGAREVAKVAGALRKEGVHKEAVDTLLEAVADFKTRIAPTLATIDSLSADLRAARTQCVDRDELRTKNDRLRADAQRSEQLAESAAALAEKAQAGKAAADREAREAHALAEEMAAEAERAAKKLQEREREIGEQKEWLEQHKRDIERLRRKRDAAVAQNKALQSEVEGLKEQLDQAHTSADDSLRVIAEYARSEASASKFSTPARSARSVIATPSTSRSGVTSVLAPSDPFTAPPSSFTAEAEPDEDGEEYLHGPSYPTDWQLPGAAFKKRKLGHMHHHGGVEKENLRARRGMVAADLKSKPQMPITMDRRGRVVGQVQLGTRQRMSAGWGHGM